MLPHNLERGRSQSIAANLLDPSLLGLGAIPDTLCDPHEDEAYLVLPLSGNVNPLSVMIRKHSSEKNCNENNFVLISFSSNVKFKTRVTSF